MKKLMVLLLLSLGVKGQEIGIYSPIWSYTGSAIQFTTGVVNTNTLVNAGTFTNTGNALFQSSVGISATTNTIGNMTLISSSTATTTMPATSGTVANLSDAIFQITFFHSSSSPGDAATLYFGNSGYPYWAVNHSTVNIPMNCTLIGWDYNIVCNSVIGTGEASTLTIAGTTTAALSTGITFSAPSAYNAFSATGLSVDFNANDKINARLVTPTWATNPTALIGGLTLYFRRRS